MDPISITVAALVVKALDQFATDAGKHAWSGLTKLVDVVKSRFAGDEPANAALDSARATPDDEGSVRALANAVDRYVREDPQFRSTVTELARRAEADPMIGTFVVEVRDNAQIGKLVNITEVHGDVNF